MTDIVPIRRALISVSDKTGLGELARGLLAKNIAILSTGGTAKFLRENNIAVTDIDSVTGFPEILDGRVKTLHPAIHGALLADLDRAAHRDALRDHHIEPIDLLVVNLYPFAAALAAGSDHQRMIEMIDVGGPAMIRAAAKNQGRLTVLTDPTQYDAVLAAIDSHGGTTRAVRAKLAADAFALTAAYDAMIAQYLTRAAGSDEAWPDHLVIAAKRRAILRYGENPHQAAALYADFPPVPGRPSIVDAQQLQGKELSYNNINDADAALALVAEFSEPAAVIVKHANPCGVALGSDSAEAFAKALAGDPVSAFGGIVALNRPVDAATAAQIAPIFFEVVVAPGIDAEAAAILAGKKNLRVLATGTLPDPSEFSWQIRQVAGGYLVQQRDALSPWQETARAVTQREPSPAQWRDLRFAQTVVKHVKSNAIVLARDGITIGIGAGQMSRVEAARIAISKAIALGSDSGQGAQNAVAASDAFFPFADGVELLAEAGIAAIIQPGGSVKDQDVFAAADRAGLAMVVTGQRHFRH